MRMMLSALGNLLIVAGLGGLALLAFQPTNGSVTGTSDAATQMVVSPSAGGVDVDRGDFPATSPLTGPANADPATIPRAVPSSVITAAAVPSISLQADVVVAKLIEREGVITWEVPGFKAGHAQYTGGAGEVGNAVLLGHVSSRSLGNVFKDLERVQVGDVVSLFSGPRQFHYRVVEIRSVPRTDVSVLQPTETASLSLITCTGVWLPFIWDYSDRLVVRAELLAPAMSE